MGLGLARAGSLVAKVPNCIVIGFTIGIAVTVAFSLVEEALGIPKNSGAYPGFWPKLLYVHEHVGDVNGDALTPALATLMCMLLMQFSVFMPAALMSLVFSTILAQTVWKEKHLTNIYDSYGHIS